MALFKLGSVNPSSLRDPLLRGRTDGWLAGGRAVDLGRQCVLQQAIELFEM